MSATDERTNNRGRQRATPGWLVPYKYFCRAARFFLEPSPSFSASDRLLCPRGGGQGKEEEEKLATPRSWASFFFFQWLVVLLRRIAFRMADLEGGWMVAGLCFGFGGCAEKACWKEERDFQEEGDFFSGLAGKPSEGGSRNEDDAKRGQRGVSDPPLPFPSIPFPSSKTKWHHSATTAIQAGS